MKADPSSVAAKNPHLASRGIGAALRCSAVIDGGVASGGFGSCRNIAKVPLANPPIHNGGNTAFINSVCADEIVRSILPTDLRQSYLGVCGFSPAATIDDDTVKP